MGQAKKRGTLEERVAAAKAKIEALRPDKLVCGACQTAFEEFDAMDTRNMPGLQAVFGGQCPACGESVLAFKGEPDAVADAMIAWQEMMGEDAKIGSQTRDGRHVAFDDE